MTKTLLDDTLDNLYEDDYTEDDVMYVGTDEGDYASNWAEFAKRAARVPYNDTRIYSFVVKLKNGAWLKRYRDDDEIEWYLTEPPTEPYNPKPLHKLWVR